MIPAEIHSVMYNRVQPHDVIQAVLQQEIVLYCGRLIATEPLVFKGILKIRVGLVIINKKKFIDCRCRFFDVFFNLMIHPDWKFLSHSNGKKDKSVIIYTSHSK